MEQISALQGALWLAYLALGVAAVIGAVRWPERARIDIALLFGAIALAVLLQVLPLLLGEPVPWVSAVVTLLLLLLPYLLMRLADSIHDVPGWMRAGTLVGYAALAVATVVAPQPMPTPLALAVIGYLVAGEVCAAWIFLRVARRSAGITRRRMLAVAGGCGLLAALFLLSGFSRVDAEDAAVYTTLSRLAGLLAAGAFFLGFFPPALLRQAWRLPELLAYLRAARWGPRAAAEEVGAAEATAADAVALDQLTAAVARTVGGRRALLVLEDRARGDFYLWGAPSARVPRGVGLVGKVAESGRARFVRELREQDLAPAVQDLFRAAGAPRSALLSPVVVHGRVVGVLGVYADKGPIFVQDDLDVLAFFAEEAAAILREREYRETAEELAALRAADRLKDEFMAVVSHELRTPLTAITGYADILLRQISGSLNERQERQVQGIREASRRLLALINDLLDVSKLETGTLELRREPVDAHAAVERAVSGTRIIARTKGVDIELADPAVTIPPVLADPERLQQILVNLLSNAIKFTPAGGKVVAGLEAQPAPQGSGMEVLFTVTDTGVGMAEQELERVWDRFYQADSTSTRRFGGTGLGLSIVKRLAELHGGRVQAFSAGPDQGSRFVVHLPAATVGVTPSPVAEPATTPELLVAQAGEGAAAPLVLVVEDDPDIATVLRTYLETEGYRVAVAADGYEALQLARALRPMAVTLDIMLPKLDGWSVLNALKRDPATAEVPVVVVSIIENRDFAMVLGATDYLVKPIDHERFRRVVARVAGRPAPGHADLLVVDDDPAVLDMLRTTLAEQGWRVRTATNGEEALAEIRREPPAALLLDLMMPGVDGFEVLRSLREDAVTQDLPVVVITARELSGEERARLAGAAQRVLLKQSSGGKDSLRQQILSALRSIGTAAPAPGVNDASNGDHEAARPGIGAGHMPSERD